MKKISYLVGIDEAGRGPLAGPVAVGLVLVKTDFDWGKELHGVGDSKKVSKIKRFEIFQKAKLLKEAKILNYQVILVSAKTIDKIGIVPSISKALNEGLDKMLTDSGINEADILIKLDGGLKAPLVYSNQETIIKGDSKELVIGLASILAKVTRDQYMEKIALKDEYKSYNFSKHKGYGTKDHRMAILNNGLSNEHRVSFCQNVLNHNKT